MGLVHPIEQSRLDRLGGGPLVKVFDGVDGFLTNGARLAGDEFLRRFAEVVIDGFFKEGLIFGDEVV